MEERKKRRYANTKTTLRRKKNPPRKELYKARLKSNMRQREVAEKLGIWQKTYARYELGTGNPSLELGAELEKLLKTPIEKLFPDIFYHFGEKWDDFYRFQGYTEREIILAHKKYAKYRLFHPLKRPKHAKKDWSQWHN
jgi:transcriptional regulator with XRE-family HTH domain